MPIIKTHHNRFEFLDFVRFVAAFAVLCQHVFEQFYLGFAHFTTYYFQLGLFGVTLFFLCSGFIIPVSLEKSQSLKKFWTGRLFRLFPLYYLSLFSTILFIAVNLIHLPQFPINVVLLNMTMFQYLIAKPSVISVYWSLSMEMLFYLIVSCLFLFKWLSKTFQNALIAIGVCLCMSVILPGVFHIMSHGWGLVFNLATMFIGTVYFKHANGKLSNRKLAFILVLAVITIVCVCYVNLYGKDNPKGGGDLSFIPHLTALLSAYIVFTIAYFLRTFGVNKVFLKLGEISYSLYLIQGTILLTVPKFKNNPIFGASVWLVLTICFSFLTYYGVEKPFINIGRKVNRTPDKPIPLTATEIV